MKTTKFLKAVFILLTILAFTVLKMNRSLSYSINFSQQGISIQNFEKWINYSNLITKLSLEKRVPEKEVIKYAYKRKLFNTKEKLKKYQKLFRQLELLILMYDIPYNARLEKIKDYILPKLFEENQDKFIPVCLYSHIKVRSEPLETLTYLEISKIANSLSLLSTEKEAIRKINLTNKERSLNYTFLIKQERWGQVILKERFFAKTKFYSDFQEIISISKYYFYPFKKTKNLNKQEKMKKEKNLNNLISGQVKIIGKDISVMDVITKFSNIKNRLLNDEECIKFPEKFHQFLNIVNFINLKLQNIIENMRSVISFYPNCKTIKCVLTNLNNTISKLSQANDEYIFIKKGNFLSAKIAYKTFLEELIKELKHIALNYNEVKILKKDSFSEHISFDNIPFYITYLKCIPFYSMDGKIGLAAIVKFKYNPERYKIILNIKNTNLKFISIGKKVYMMDTEMNYEILEKLDIDIENPCIRKFKKLLISKYSNNWKKLPVTCLTLKDIHHILTKLNSLYSAKYKFRLPFCEEWKKIAQRESLKGKVCSCLKEGCSINFSGKLPFPVDNGTPDSLGFYYLCGNVAEYCMDSYRDLFYIGGHFNGFEEDVFKEYIGFEKPWVGLRLVLIIK